MEEAGTDINDLFAELRGQIEASEDEANAKNRPLDVGEEDTEDEQFSEPQFTWSGCLGVESQMEGLVHRNELEKSQLYYRTLHQMGLSIMELGILLTHCLDQGVKTRSSRLGI
jgi:hypothetical protein